MEKKNLHSLDEQFSSFFRSFAIYAIAIIFLAIISIFILNSYLPSPSWEWGIESSPLQHNAKHSIRADQEWIYEINSTHSPSQKIQLNAFFHPSCPGVVFADITNAQRFHSSLENAMLQNPGVYAICIGMEGYESNSHGNKIGNELGFENSSFPYYAPWMLSLNENFSWKANRTLTIHPTNHTEKTSISLKTINTTKFMGRDAFYVIIKQEGGTGMLGQALGKTNSNFSMLIDKEFRILLFAQHQNSSITLISAPFKLGEKLNNS
ncbi:MAG: hypothetical protein ABIH83_00340 [Candidatus Micrarchaeota archaeon]